MLEVRREDGGKVEVTKNSIGHVQLENFLTQQISSGAFCLPFNKPLDLLSFKVMMLFEENFLSIS